MCDLSYFGITTFLLKSSKNKQKEAGDGQNLKNWITYYYLLTNLNNKILIFEKI